MLYIPGPSLISFTFSLCMMSSSPQLKPPLLASSTTASTATTKRSVPWGPGKMAQHATLCEKWNLALRSKHLNHNRKKKKKKKAKSGLCLCTTWVGMGLTGAKEPLLPESQNSWCLRPRPYLSSSPIFHLSTHSPTDWYTLLLAPSFTVPPLDQHVPAFNLMWHNSD